MEEEKRAAGKAGAGNPSPWKRLLRVEGGLGFVAIAFVCADYLREISPAWHKVLQPALWAALALAAVARVPFYRHWSLELRAALPFVLSMVFMLAAFLIEMLSVRFVTAVLGLDWHQSWNPLPDTGQWLLLALNERLPHVVIEILRAHLIGLEHFLMLFMILGFSVLFNSVKAPGLGLAARYMFTMAIGRLLRVVTFISTILPAVRPWCAKYRYRIPTHPHPWAQKYLVPYMESDSIRQLVLTDTHYATPGSYPSEYHPNWGFMNFLVNILRPTHSDGPSWYHLLKRASGGCNDLLYSGHMLVAVLTAMAWTESYGGFTSVVIWLLVLHSAQREVRERHHYSVDCIVAIYVGVLLWRMSGFIWSAKDTSKARRVAKFDEVQDKVFRAMKDSDMERVKEILKEVETAGQEKPGFSELALWAFASITIVFTLAVVALALILTNDG